MVELIQKEIVVEISILLLHQIQIIMRKSLNFLAFLLCIFTINAQSSIDGIAKGDILVLDEPSGASYSHVNFPRKNIIIKRGAIPNFKAILGKRLIVEAITTNEKGKVIATLRRADGLNFFRFFPKVKADVAKALQAGELKSS